MLIAGDLGRAGVTCSVLGSLGIMSAEPFTNLVTSEAELRNDGYPEPPPRAWEKEIELLDEQCGNFLSRSPFAMLATSDAQGRTTVTPRGGPPGFVRVLDDRRIAWADLTGNRRIDAFRQILENPQVGLIFMIPGLRETLRIDGTAYLTRDPAVLRAVDVPGRTADLAVGVVVRTAFVHCGKALIRSKLWEPDCWPAREDLPSAAAMLLAARHEQVPVEVVEKQLEEGYLTHLW